MIRLAHMVNRIRERRNGATRPPPNRVPDERAGSLVGGPDVDPPLPVCIP